MLITLNDTSRKPCIRYDCIYEKYKICDQIQVIRSFKDTLEMEMNSEYIESMSAKCSLFKEWYEKQQVGL